MKKILIILFVLFAVCSYSQTVSNINLSEDQQFKNIAEKLNLKPGSDHKIAVIFTIDENGDISNVKARAAYPELEAEAIRIVSELSPMEPIIRDGVAVRQNFSLPIIFHVETLKEKKARLKKERKKKEKEGSNE